MTKPAVFVVGLGASAGGLEALERFLDHCPSDSGGAFVVVMHLSRSFKSMLGELLGRHTSMDVKPALDGDSVTADTVYVIQPGTILELNGPFFKVTPRPTIDPSGPSTHIDTLFRSIGRHWQSRGAGIVLSGTGSDGASGVVALQDGGGFACAQAPETAKFDSMILAAIASGSVRAIEAPEQLGSTVVEGLLYRTFSSPAPTHTENNEAALACILDAVVGASSASVTKYKNSAFERRVRRRMMHFHIDSMEEYANRIESDPAEARHLSESLLIGVTEFFRDNPAFKVLGQQVVPELIRRAQVERRAIRVWVAGCATGEEAYSIAMLFLEAFEELPEKLELQIFATDLKREHLAEAARGEYSQEKVDKIPLSLRKKFFTSSNGSTKWVVNPSLRQCIVFAPHDILIDPPFTRLDLVSCRNLLIYFSLDAQQRIIGNFAFGLMEQGFLFLGPSETVGGHRESFDFVDARHRIFKRTGSPRPRPMLSLEAEPGGRRFMRKPSLKLPAKMREASLQPAYAALLAEYAPSSLLISAERELLHSFGDAREYIRPPPGVAHLDLAEMVDTGLKTPVIAGVDRALRDRKAVTFSRINIEQYPEQGGVVDLTVRPLSQDDAEPHQLLVIISRSDVRTDDLKLEATSLSAGDLAQERIRELEEELERTREALQSTVEEFETANEELQSSNEELMSSNEELQSTNEELSSVNEELYSVNSEYHRQNDVLGRLNADFDLLLKATEIGVIFLDADHNITRFAGWASSQFQLSETDVGRPFSTFRSPFVDGEPRELVDLALRSEHPVESELRDTFGDSWLLRAVSHPQGDGAVLTIINIERLRAAEEEARRTTEMLNEVRTAANAFYLETDNQLSLIQRQLGWADRVGQDLAGRMSLSMEVFPRGDRDKVRRELQRAREKNDFDLVAPIYDKASKTYRFARLLGQRCTLKDAHGDGYEGWRITGTDVDLIVEREREARRREAILEGILKASPVLLAYVDTDETYRYVNDAYAQKWGRPRDEIVGRTMAQVLPAEVYEEAKPHIDGALSGRREVYETNYLASDSADDVSSVTLEPVLGDDAEIDGFAVGIQDVGFFYQRVDTLQRVDRMFVEAARVGPYPTMLVDADSLTVEYANQAALRHLGLKTGQPLPEAWGVSNMTQEWGDGTWTTWLKSIPADGGGVRNDVAIVDGSGHSRTADLFAQVTEDERRMAVIHAFINDDRAADLQRLRARARRLAVTNRDMEQFATSVALNLRGPLKDLSSTVEWLGANPDATPPDREGKLAKIGSGIGQMGSLVDDLLEYTQLGRDGDLDSPIRLRESLQELAKGFRQSLQQNGAELDVKVPSNVVVAGDWALLRQMFDKLVDNARQNPKPDQPLRIEIDVEASDEGRVTVYVTDNGIGIDPSVGSRIFDVFHGVDDGRRGSGLGLGLAACRRICEIHGGEIRLDTSYLEGARFIITLPRVARPHGSFISTGLESQMANPS